MSQQKQQDDCRIIDVDGTQQVCPDCGSKSCKLIPFAGDEFEGANFVCYSCSKIKQLKM